MMIGAGLAGASKEETGKSEQAASRIGIAFQIQDDILDIEGDAQVLGKTTGKDAREAKSTFPSLLGLEECRRLADSLTAEAVPAISGMAGPGFLTGLARSLTGRAKGIPIFMQFS